MIDAAESLDLAFQVSGLLEELPVIEAQDVERGAIIAKLDQRDFQSNYDKVKAQFDNAEAEYRRALELVEDNLVSRSQLDQLKSQRDVARAQLDAAEKALSDTVLRAPCACVIARVPAKRLQNVQPGEVIATIISREELEATINMPASIIAQIPRQEDQRTEAIIFVVLDAAPANRIPATFKEAALEADPASQTYEVTFAFSPPEDLTILPGMNATVVLTPPAASTGTQNVSVAIPLAAVLSDGDQQYVWVVNSETMMVSKRGINIADGIGETVIVTEGVMPGEVIVGAGASYLAEGMKVRPWTNK